MSGVQMTLGGIRFNGPAQQGISWYADEVEGVGGPGVRYESGGRAQQDGAWSTTSFREAAAMALSGVAVVDSLADMRRAIRELDLAVSLRRFPLTMHWPDGDLTRNVKRDGELAVEPVAGEGLRWSCQVVAEDPRWYVGGPPPGTSPVPGVEFPSDGFQVHETGLPRSEGGISFPVALPFAFEAETVSGEFVAHTDSAGWWLFVIEAGAASLTDPAINVVGPGGDSRSVGWSLVLAPGEFLVVDPQRRSSLLQGAGVRPPLRREWPVVQRGANTVQFRGTQDDGGGATLRMFFVPAE